jgi:hypothetical protein
VRPQTLRFLDFLDRTVAAGGRRTVRAVVELDPRFPANHCVVQEAIFDLSTGRPQLLGDPKVLPQGQSPPEPDSP